MAGHDAPGRGPTAAQAHMSAKRGDRVQRRNNTRRPAGKRHCSAFFAESRVQKRRRRGNLRGTPLRWHSHASMRTGSTTHKVRVEDERRRASSRNNTQDMRGCPAPPIGNPSSAVPEATGPRAATLARPGRQPINGARRREAGPPPRMCAVASLR